MTNTDFKVGVIKPIECFKEGWELIKDRYWLFFGITIVGMLIAGLIPLALGMGAMYCGIYYAMLKQMDRKPVEFSDLFKGFNWFLPGLIATLVIIVPMIVFMIITYGSMFGILFSMMDQRGQIQPAAIFTLYGVLIVEGVVFGIIMSCIHAFIMFTFPLIADRNLSGLDALKLSARAGWANLSGVVGLILVQFGIGFVGYLACGVGLYFVFPVMFAGVLVAYRRVFPSLTSNDFGVPPAPNSYPNAGNYS